MNLSTFRRHYFVTFPNLIILFGLALVFFSFGPLIKDEVWYQLKQLKGQVYGLNLSGGQEDSPFARFLTSKPVSLTPVNTDFSIVIEKIGVNAPIVADVSVANEDAYKEALKNGIAHASSSPYPSQQPGNTYLFAHASVNFWELGKYATVFNLLRKLEVGDRVHLFRNNVMYLYEVVNKESLKGWNTYPILRPVIEPTLTLQTCDPPGTTINRLVVTAKLLRIEEL